MGNSYQNNTNSIGEILYCLAVPVEKANKSKGRKFMRRPRSSSDCDVNRMTESLMIDVFKTIIREAELDLQELKGTWEEASEFLRIHFGKLSRVMVSNQGNLHRLYQDSIAELRKA